MEKRVIDFFRGKYYFLSNFYPGDISTLEHKYQSKKAIHKEDSVWILLARTPGEAKRRGRRIPIRKDWDNVKLEVMLELVRLKFDIPTLKKKLLGTGNAELVEGNWWEDTFWGVCNGVGENHLGKILMKVREEIRKEV